MTGFRLWHDTHLGKTNCSNKLCKDDEATKGPQKKGVALPTKEAKELDPMVLEPPNDCQGGRSWKSEADSKTVVDWINGHAKQQKAQQYCCDPSETNEGLVAQGYRPTTTHYRPGFPRT